ncbi:MAG: hypothetical protein C4527_22995 [Candidatus Omnitrophota bacterium]|jgi:hypothetical protein|nr:MAG: hypothetical protein C4527_22995 [Candidatus Omnitrophota bacterium]
MPTKRCEICRKPKKIDEISLCCTDCEERELDLLLAVYAFIHCYDSDYCPADVLVKSIEPVNRIQLTHNFIRSWLKKQWLQKNELNALCVPPAIQETIDMDGFQLTRAIRSVLKRQQEKKPLIDPILLKDAKKNEENKKRIGMVFMEKKKD